MNLFFRLIFHVLSAMRKPALGPVDLCVADFRVYPTDLDINMHMNNGRFLSIMDIARVELIVRTGLLPHLRKNRWHPVVTTSHITYRRSLNLFDKYQIETQIIGWEEHRFYMRQAFMREGELMAEAFLEGLFLSRSGRVPVSRLIEITGYDGEQLQVPDEIRQYFPKLQHGAITANDAPKSKAPAGL